MTAVGFVIEEEERLRGEIVLAVDVDQGAGQSRKGGQGGESGEGRRGRIERRVVRVDVLVDLVLQRRMNGRRRVEQLRLEPQVVRRQRHIVDVARGGGARHRRRWRNGQFAARGARSGGGFVVRHGGRGGWTGGATIDASGGGQQWRRRIGLLLQVAAEILFAQIARLDRQVDAAV